MFSLLPYFALVFVVAIIDGAGNEVGKVAARKVISSFRNRDDQK